MTLATIIVLSVGVILIIVSFLLTGKDSGEEETEERTTPGLREELTEADKKQLKKLTDNYIREYGKKQVKDSVQSTIDNRVKEAADAKQPAIDEKLKVIDQKMAAVDERLAEIDACSEAGVKAVADEASAISAGWDQNRQEVQSVYEQISEKEKDVKIQLSLIDEYKKGLEKLKEDADLSVNRLQELQQVESAGRFVPAAEEAVEEAAKDAEEAVWKLLRL